jgi:hypothetical protein
MEYPYTRSSNLFNLLSSFVGAGTLPLEFDPNFYRMLHDEVQKLSDEEALAHYNEIGRASGAIGSPAAHRAGFLQALPRHADIIEIKPSTKPAILGPNVKYFDLYNKNDLIDRARQTGSPIENPVDIDFVSPADELHILPEYSFDFMFSSHEIQRSPDLVRHLIDASRTLRSVGWYFLIIPDKRYCFDHFLEVSSLEDVIRAHEERRTSHAVRSIFQHHALTTHSDPIAHWRDWHEDPNASEFRDRAIRAMRVADEARGKCLDINAWQFTPESFRKIIDELGDRKLIDFRIERVYDTVWSQYEFMVVLRK